VPRSGSVIATAAFLGVGAVAVVWGPGLFATYAASDASNTCTVTTVDAEFTLSAERADYAATIAAVGWNRGFGDEGVTVALATAIQESGLLNLDYGDRDSVGLFQQRTSQGWGTIEEIMDPRYSAGKFYDTLSRIDGWNQLAVTEAAQAVQRSGFPNAYADHESEGRAWAEALGGTAGAVTCDVSAAAVTTAQSLSERVALDFPQGGYAVDVLGYEGSTTQLGIRPPDASDQSLARLQAWSIATASTTGVTEAAVQGSQWHRDGTWTHDDPSPQWADYRGVLVGLQTS